MTRNQHERSSQIRDAIGPPPKTGEAYQLAAHAKRYAAIMDGGPMAWARSVHTMHTAGQMAPRKEPSDGAAVGKHVEDKLRPQAQATIRRGENELRMRTLVKAIRMLSASADPKDNKMAADLAKFLEYAWGVRRAYEAVSEGDAELYDQLRDAWGEVQLPPPDSTVNKYSADELFIQAAVRRLG